MDFENFIKETDTIQNSKQDEHKNLSEKGEHYREMADVFGAIKGVSSDISNTIKNKKSISISNLPDSILTPDIDKVVAELKLVRGDISKIDPIDKTTHQLLQNLITAIDSLPEPKEVVIPEVKIPEYPDNIKVNNLDEIKLDTSKVEKAIKGIKLVSKPTINAKTDINELIPHLNALQGAIESIQVKVPENDNKPVLRALTGVKDAINSLTFPTSNYIFPFKDASGSATQVQLDSNGKLPVSATISTTGIATETTLAKTVSFDENDDLTVSIVTAGTVKTITETDGVRTRTTVIDKTDPNSIPITVTWS